MVVLNILKDRMDITVKNLQSSISVPISKIQLVAQQAVDQLTREGVLSRSLAELSIVFVGTQRMRTLNKRYLGHDYVTDIVTFNLESSAELIICPQVAAVNAKGYGMPVSKELVLYVIHGLLHLAGYDDHTPSDIKRIRAKEQELMGKLA